jgi:alanine dehydrogenase
VPVVNRTILRHPPGLAPTRALTNVTLPYAVALGNKGWRRACAEDASLALGVNITAASWSTPPWAKRQDWAVALGDVLAGG